MTASPARPNIVYLHAHDLGRYCEPFGYAIPAPNLMRLCHEGLLFRQCHSAAPSCAPSRAALVTGRWPHCNGMLGLPSEHLGYQLTDYRQHLGWWLKDQGYHCVLAGVQHVARKPMVDPYEVLPYDEFLTDANEDMGGVHRSLTTPLAVEFLNRKHEQPFFLSVGLLDPHRDNRGDRATFVESTPTARPHDLDKRARYTQPWPHMPDNPITRAEMAAFIDGVRAMDDDIGRLLRALDTEALRHNTLVIFTSDHGPGVTGMKCTLSDRGTGVPLILRGPLDARYGDASRCRDGRVSEALVSQIDIFPTICDLLGAPAPDHLQGRSLLPLIRGERNQINPHIFTEQTYHWGAQPRPMRAIRTERYKLVRCKPDQPKGVDTGPAEEWWRALGHAEMPYDAEALYDLWFDPHEAHNLLPGGGHDAIAAELGATLDQWQADTGDPLLAGIPVPPAQPV